MTKYVLHGGLPKDGGYTKEFFDEIVLGISKKKLEVLYLPSSDDPDKRNRKTQSKQQQFDTFLPDRESTVVVADTNPEKFMNNPRPYGRGF